MRYSVSLINLYPQGLQIRTFTKIMSASHHNSPKIFLLDVTTKIFLRSIINDVYCFAVLADRKKKTKKNSDYSLPKQSSVKQDA